MSGNVPHMVSPLFSDTNFSLHLKHMPNRLLQRLCFWHAFYKYLITFLWENVVYVELLHSFPQTLHANIKLATEAEGFRWSSLQFHRSYLLTTCQSTKYNPNRSFNHSRQMSPKIRPTPVHYPVINLPFDGLTVWPTTDSLINHK